MNAIHAFPVLKDKLLNIVVMSRTQGRLLCSLDISVFPYIQSVAVPCNYCAAYRDTHDMVWETKLLLCVSFPAASTTFPSNTHPLKWSRPQALISSDCLQMVSFGKQSLHREGGKPQLEVNPNGLHNAARSLMYLHGETATENRKKLLKLFFYIECYLYNWKLWWFSQPPQCFICWQVWDINKAFCPVYLRDCGLSLLLLYCANFASTLFVYFWAIPYCPLPHRKLPIKMSCTVMILTRWFWSGQLQCRKQLQFLLMSLKLILITYFRLWTSPWVRKKYEVVIVYVALVDHKHEPGAEQ